MSSVTTDWENLTTEELEEAVQFHNRKYWIENAPIISDPDFDRLVEALKERAPDSPVLEAIGPAGVDVDIDEPVEKVPHDPPMLSLDKGYDEETLVKWFDKFEGPAVATPKMDGVAASLRYDADGRMFLAATRGNGTFGEIITDNVRQIVNLPLELNADALPGHAIEVRGEAYMPLSVFEAKFKGEYASPRNLTAGALKLKDVTKTAHYEIHFFAYDLLGIDFETEIEKIRFLAELGFEVDHPEVLERGDLQRAFERFAAMRPGLDYEIDGVVFKANLCAEQQRLGHTSHHPRYAIAYKFQGDVGESVLREVHWSVSRTGAINPVGIVDPVELSGAVVTRVSLHNLAIMEGLGGEEGLRLGSRVLMMRRGGVIPNLERVLEAGAEPAKIPERCPGCGAPTRRENDVLVADHEASCRNARIRQLEHFTQVMEIKGFGPKLIEQLYDEEIITEPADFFTLTVEELESLERVGRRLAEKLVGRIQERRTVPATLFLRALGIDELGKHVSKILAARYPDLDAILAVSAEELAGIHTIGEVIAEKVTRGFEMNRELIDDLRRHVTLIFEAEEEVVVDGDSPLAGKKVLFTGAMESMTRSEAQKKVRELGGQTPSSVTKDLDFLVMGDADMERFEAGWRSSKLKKVEKYNADGGQTRIIGETEFLNLLPS